MKIISSLHLYWAFVLLISMLFLIVRFVRAMMKKKAYGAMDLHLTIYVLIFAGIQVFLGLSRYFSSPGYHYLKQHGLSAVLDDRNKLIVAVLHPLVMLVSFALMWRGFQLHKKASSGQLHRVILKYYAIAFLLMLLLIPHGH